MGFLCCIHDFQVYFARYGCIPKVIFCFIGDFHADFTGHSGDKGQGAGLSQSHHAGASGGGHGGRGGRSYTGYYSALAYDSIYMPSEMGSGGGTGSHEGGRGGGKLFIGSGEGWKGGQGTKD